jgi:DNA-binding response OmpR family regulator
LLRWMRSQDKARRLPVVIVSAHAQPELHNIAGGAVGVVDWIEKPIDQRRLLAVLQNATRPNNDGVPPILHVEDDLDLDNVIATLLDPAYKVVHAPMLEDASNKLARDDFSLILLDLHLADGHGSKLLASLPARNASTPVVLFSGEEASRSVTEKVHAALVKSRASNGQLLAILHNLIGKTPFGNSPKEEKWVVPR